MSETVIKLENISKKYRLGLVGSNTLKGDLQAWWYRVRGKEDPTLKIGEENRLDESGGKYVWALRDINLEVKQGEVLGIIGKNGAGKSTLLKLLSQITTPTTGSIKVKGRIASLLEVGTGFHPELTGRENIFLNGAILGMTKAEIKRKMDEIIDFAGVAKYVDTPVKRYSSGMRVRLGFAVAAFLEPEILVVDEVLAVGDAEFQKKAIGKMQDISSGQGRTVLFVSHNMASVKTLCTNAILLEKGQIKKSGSTDEIVSYYLSDGGVNSTQYKEFDPQKAGNSEIFINEIGINAEGKSTEEPISRDNDLDVFLKYTYNKKSSNLYHINLRFKSEDGVYLFSTASLSSNKVLLQGEHELLVKIPKSFLKEGNYLIDLMIIKNRKSSIYKEDDILVFSVNPEQKEIGNFMGKGKTYLTPNFKWQNL